MVMILNENTELSPGYYFITFSRNNGVVIQNPDIRVGNVIFAHKVSLDRLDVDGGQIIISLQDVNVIEPISQEKLNWMKNQGTEGINIRHLKSKVEVNNLINQAKQMGIIDPNQNQQPNPNSTGDGDYLRQEQTGGKPHIEPPSR